MRYLYPGPNPKGWIWMFYKSGGWKGFQIYGKIKIYKSGSQWFFLCGVCGQFFWYYLLRKMFFLEHLPYRQREFLEKIRKILAPGGLLILATPNLTSFFKKERGCFFGRSPYWDLDDFFFAGAAILGHFREFTGEELKKMAGLERIWSLAVKSIIRISRADGSGVLKKCRLWFPGLFPAFSRPAATLFFLSLKNYKAKLSWKMRGGIYFFRLASGRLLIPPIIIMFLDSPLRTKKYIPPRFI